MGGGEDPQKIKKTAAKAYDYDNDPRWAEYWSNILIPPNLTSRPVVVDHFKQKFYQRYIDPELVVEPMALNNSSQPSKSSSSSSSSHPQTDQARPRNSGSNTRTSRASAAAGPNAPTSSLRLNQQTIQFSVNSWVFVVAILAVLPIAPRHLSDRAYRLSFMGTACSSFYSLYSLYGKPRAWNLQALQSWFQPIVMAADFIYLVYCLTFISSHLCLRCS